MVKMFWMIVGAISVPLVYGFLRTEKFYDGVSIVAPGYSHFIQASEK
jgi:hypothetical protein